MNLSTIFGKKTILLLAGFVFMVWSCDEVLDTDDYDIQSVEASPTVALPLAYGDLSIQDLLSKTDSTNIKVDGNGLVYIEYDQTLKSQAIRDLVNIQDQNNLTKTIAVPPGVLPPVPSDVNSTQVTQTVPFDLDPDDLALTEVLFTQGQIMYNLTSPNASLRYAINISIPKFVSESDGTSFSKELAPSGPPVSLAGYKYSSLVANEFTIIFTLVLKQNPNPTIIAPATNILANISFRGMQYRYAKGFFGTQSTEVLEENIDLNAFGTSLTNGTNVFFADPKLEFSVISSVGVPTSVQFFALEARKPGRSLPLQITPASPLTIKAPTTLGTTETTTVRVDNVKDLLNFAPTQLYYRFRAHINQGLTSGNNFVSDTSTLRVNMHVNVPLYGHASNIRLSDTLSIDFDDVDQSNVESAALKIKATNQIPLEAFIQFYLTTENYQVIDSLLAPDQTQLVKASVVTSGGELQTPGLKDDLIQINKDKLNKIFQAKKIIIRARMNTSNTNGTFPDVKFKSNQKIDIKLGLQAKLKIKADL